MLLCTLACEGAQHTVVSLVTLTMVNQQTGPQPRGTVEHVYWLYGMTTYHSDKRVLWKGLDYWQFLVICLDTVEPVHMLQAWAPVC